METLRLSRVDDVAVFVRVVERGGFSAAARELDVTPGAVSKHIARLEGRLGLRLFDRNTRRVKLTDEGTAAVEHARRIVESIDALAEVASRSRGVLEGAVRITAPVPFGRKFVAPLIADFRGLHPKVDFELQLSDQVADLLHSDIDLAIRIGALPDSTLVARRIAQNHRVLVASPAYLEKHGRPATAADLARHTCLVFGYPGALQNVWSLQNGRRWARVPVRASLRSDNGEVLRDWCLRGLGISLRETWDIAGELRARSLVRVLPRWEAEPTNIFAVRAARSPLPYRIAAFLNFIAARWARPPWEEVAPPPARPAG